MATIQALPFVPTSVSPCSLWLDASDPSTLVLSGTNILQWNDKSGNTRNGTTSGIITNTGSINGRTAASFPSALNTYLVGANSNTGSTLTAFGVVAMNSNSGAYARILSFSSYDTGGRDSATTAAQPLIRWNSGANISGAQASTQLGTTAISYTVPILVCSQWNGAVNTMYANGSTGTSVANVRTFGYTNYTIGINYADNANSLFSGLIGELIAYNASLTTPQRQQVEGYLAWKWGLQNSLPTSHPYYYAPPNSAGLIYPSALKVSVPTQSLFPSQSPFYFFRPPSISGCVMWLDGTDPNGTGIQPANNATVSTWTDKSGNDNNGTGGSAQFQTNKLNNLAGIYFGGGTSYNIAKPGLLPAGTTGGSSFFCVFAGSGADAGLLAYAGASIACDKTGRIWYINTSTNGIFATMYCGAAQTFNVYTANTPFLLSDVYTNTGSGSFNHSSWTSGNPFSTASAGVTGANTGTAQAKIGNSLTGSLFTGYMYELIMYSGSLTTAQRQQVEGYLAWKWGFGSQLPSNHPYKTSVPGLPIALPITKTFQQSSFSPARISGCLMWLDANDINGTGVNPPLGTTFTTWTDKSGSGNTVIAGVASTTTNYSGRNAVFLNGNSFTRSATFAVANTTIFLVFAVSTGQNDRPFMTIGAGANSGSGDCTVLYCDANVTKPGGSPLGRIYYGSGGGTQLTISYGTASAADVIPYCIQSITVSSSPVVTNFLNGFTNATKTGTVPRVSVNNATIGGSLVWYLSEFIVYNSVLSDSTRQSVEGYLAWKWNLQGSLPSTSPFKKLPPLPN